jgi:O-methyltransferase
MDYLELLKRTLTASIYPESAIEILECSRHPTCRIVLRVLKRFGYGLFRAKHFDSVVRANGGDWPFIGYTMVGHKRLDNVRFAVETALKESVPGDLVECGVWRGGCAIFMRAILKCQGSDRIVWAADSFQGMPKPNGVKFAADTDQWDLSNVKSLSVSLARVKQNFAAFDLLDDQVRFLEGWFRDTLPTAPIRKIAVLRCDGDLYESTMDILDNLYDRVSPGGFVIIDDYGAWPPCKQAVEQFRRQRQITAPIETIDSDGVYWRV